MSEAARMNHYEILSLPSTPPETTKLTTAEITKAFRSKALLMHPDKCPDDPDATSKFQQLKSSYEILTNPITRKIFDDHHISSTHRNNKKRPSSQSQSQSQSKQESKEEKLRKKMAAAEEEELRRSKLVSDDEGVLEERATNWRDFLKHKSRFWSQQR